MIFKFQCSLGFCFKIKPLNPEPDITGENSKKNVLVAKEERGGGVEVQKFIEKSFSFLVKTPLSQAVTMLLSLPSNC